MPKRDGKYVLQRFDADIAIGQLTVGQVQILPISTNDEDIFHISGHFAVSIDLIEYSDPPLLYGLCPDGSATTTEIANALNADGPVNQNDREAAEKLVTRVYPLGALDARTLATDGRLVEYHHDVKLGITVYNEGTATLGTNGMTFWVYNVGSQTLATGKHLRVWCQLHSRWI